MSGMKPNKFILVQPIESTINNITNIKTVNNYTVQENSQKPHQPEEVVVSSFSSIDMEDGGAAKNNHVGMAKRPSYLNHQSTGGTGTARTMQQRGQNLIHLGETSSPIKIANSNQ